MKDGFSVRTRWQGVFSGQPNARKYGIVSVGGHDLAEMLVANGLARIHGMGIGGKTQEEVERLKVLEKQAKAEGNGTWGRGENCTLTFSRRGYYPAKYDADLFFAWKPAIKIGERGQTMRRGAPHFFGGTFDASSFR